MSRQTSEAREPIHWLRRQTTAFNQCASFLEITVIESLDQSQLQVY